MSFFGASTFTLSVLYDVLFFSILLFPVVVVSVMKPGNKPPRATSRRILLAESLVLTIVIGVIVFSTLPVKIGGRFFPLFFVVEGMLVAIVALDVFLGGHCSTQLFAVFVGCLIPMVSLYARNRMYPIYDFRSESMYLDGSISAYQQQAARYNLYYYIPVEPFLNVTLGLVTGISISTQEILTVSYLLVTLLMCWVLLRRTSYTEALPAVMLLVAVPPLSFITGRAAISLPFATVVLALFSIFTLRQRRCIILIMVLTMVVGVFSHPIAPLTVISVLAATRLAPKTLGGTRAANKFLLISLTLTLTYWFNTYIQYIMVRSGGSVYESFFRFVNMLAGSESQAAITGSTISVFQAPGYSVRKFWEFSYCWAIPIAFTISYLVAVFMSVLLRRGTRTINIAGLILGFPTGVTSLVFIWASYVGYAVGTDSAQYMTPIAYFMAVLTAMITVSKVIKSRRVVEFSIMTLVLSIAIFNGTYAPDNAPLEHTEFEVSAKIHPYICYVQSSDIQVLLDDHVQVFNDFDVQTGLGRLYKPVRQVIYDIVSGRHSLKDYDAVFILRNMRLREAILRSQVLDCNLVFSSNMHIAVHS